MFKAGEVIGHLGTHFQHSAKISTNWQSDSQTLKFWSFNTYIKSNTDRLKVTKV